MIVARELGSRGRSGFATAQQGLLGVGMGNRGVLMDSSTGYLGTGHARSAGIIEHRGNDTRCCHEPPGIVHGDQLVHLTATSSQHCQRDGLTVGTQ